jgi:hypothetical protein
MKAGIHHAAKLAFRNKSEIAFANKCGCYSCLAVFDKKEIKEWTDGGETALCPRCSIDSVIAEGTGFDLSEENLRKANQYWF